ncbi:hypothetical protein Tco_0462065 [Tanacetum coccineum]
MDPYEEVAPQGHATPLSPAYMPDPMELEHHIPVYVSEPDYPEYLAPSDDDIPVEDQPLPADASPAALSPSYVADSNPEEDLIDYAADADDDEEEESSEDDDDEEEHLAPADSIAIASPAIDHVPFAEETDPFKTDESAATPPPPPAYHVARLLALHTPPPSLLTLLSSPLLQIPSPPLPLLSPPTHTSPTYAEAPFCYRATGIWLRAASPLPLPAPSTSRRADIPEADIQPQKRLCLIAPTPRCEVGENFAAATR